MVTVSDVTDSVCNDLSQCVTSKELRNLHSDGIFTTIMYLLGDVSAATNLYMLTAASGYDR